MHSLVSTIQTAICTALESEDTHKFHTDIWTRPGGGGGVTRVLENGTTFEKAGVNVSEVHGTLSTPSELDMFKTLIQRVSPHLATQLEGATFYATGVSLVIHPKNPHVPTTHANYRYFELTTPTKETVWWVGGGADLTPYYLDEADATHFHACHKNACDTLSKTTYADYKKACDAYFYLPHRQETRGVGGIFFDYVNHYPKDVLATFIQSCANAFIEAYIPIVTAKKNTPITPSQREWQLYRRGRYVEFNLLYDRGTLFGLKTNGRIESILMSLPNLVSWKYDHHPTPNTPEAQLIDVLQTPREWV